MTRTVFRTVPPVFPRVFPRVAATALTLALGVTTAACATAEDPPTVESLAAERGEVTRDILSTVLCEEGLAEEDRRLLELNAELEAKLTELCTVWIYEVDAGELQGWEDPLQTLACELDKERAMAQCLGAQCAEDDVWDQCAQQTGLDDGSCAVPEPVASAFEMCITGTFDDESQE